MVLDLHEQPVGVSDHGCLNSKTFKFGWGMILKPRMILRPKPDDSETKTDDSATKSDSETKKMILKPRMILQPRTHGNQNGMI